MKLLTTTMVLAAIAIASPAFSQENPGGTPPGPRVRVAVVNIGLVFTKYEKANEMKKGLEADLAPLKAKAEKIKTEMKGFDAIASNPGDNPAEIVQDAKDQLLARKRQLEDLDAQARRMIGKKQETQLIELWVEIKTSIADYAKAKDYDVVLAIGDPPDTNLDNFTNINRKMTAMDTGAATPIYIRNGADISVDILNQLNEAYRRKKGPDGKEPEGSPLLRSSP